MTFKIAEGYVEIRAEIDRRSVIMSADRLTAGVADQMNTGIAFANSRRGGRLMGEIFGIHGGPGAATALTQGMSEWITQGQSTVHLERAGHSAATTIGQAMADSNVTQEFTQRITQDLNTEIDRNRGRIYTSGGILGRTLGGSAGDSASRTIRERVVRRIHETTDSDMDRPGSFLGRLLGGSAGGSLVQTMTGGLLGNLTDVGPILKTAGVAIGATLAVALSPVLAAGISAAAGLGAGLGVIGLGAFLLKDEPRLQAAAAKLKTTWVNELTKAAQPLIKPFLTSLDILTRLGERLGPSFTKMFETVAPYIEPLTRGLAGMFEKMMPGIIKLLQGAGPLFKDLESTLPRFGEDLGAFFGMLGEHGPEMAQFFRDFLHFTGLFIRGVGEIISWLTGFYTTSRDLLINIATGFRTMYRAVTGNFDDLKAAGRALADIVSSHLDRLGRFVAGVWRSITGGGNTMLGWFRGLPGQIGSALTSARNRITGVFSGAGSWLANAGRNIINGLLTGIRNAIPGLSNLLGWVTSMIPNWKGPEDTDRRLLYRAGQVTIGGYQEGIRSQIPGLARTLGGLTASIPAMAAPAIGTSAAAGTVASGGVTINNLNISISSTLDAPSLPREVAGRIFEAVRTYEKAYA